MLAQLPADVWVENSRKRPGVQPRFRPFSTAPADDPAFEGAAFSNGCEIIEKCGVGLTPTGYYPCAIAGGIDRVAGEKRGRERLPDSSDDMADVLGVGVPAVRPVQGRAPPPGPRPPPRPHDRAGVPDVGAPLRGVEPEKVGRAERREGARAGGADGERAASPDDRSRTHGASTPAEHGAQGRRGARNACERTTTRR